MLYQEREEWVWLNWCCCCCCCRLNLFYAPLVVAVCPSFGFSWLCKCANIINGSHALQLNWARPHSTTLPAAPPPLYILSLSLFQCVALSTHTAYSSVRALCGLCLAASFADRSSSCAKHTQRCHGQFLWTIFVEKHLERNSCCSVVHKPCYRVDYLLFIAVLPK